MPNPILMRKLRGGGGAPPYEPLPLAGWDHVHETFQDYEDTPTGQVLVDGGESLEYGIGWTGTTSLAGTEGRFIVAEDYVSDDGYAADVSIDGVNAGEGFEGGWVIN